MSWDGGLRRQGDDAIQLAHYRRMLEACGREAPVNLGGIIGTEAHVTWHDLDEQKYRTPTADPSAKTKRRSAMERYDFEFGFRIDIADTATRATGPDDPLLLVEPMRSTECAGCKWDGYCSPIIEADSGDVSLLPRVSYQQWRRLRNNDIRTRQAQSFSVGSLFEPSQWQPFRMALIEFTVVRDFAASSQVLWDAMIDWPGHGDWIPATRVVVDSGTGTEVGETFTGYTGYGPILLVDRMRVNAIEWNETTGHGSCEVEKLGPVLKGQAGFVVTGDSERSHIEWFERVTVPYLPQLLAPVVNKMGAAGFSFGMRSLAKSLERAR